MELPKRAPGLGPIGKSWRLMQLQQLEQVVQVTRIR